MRWFKPKFPLVNVTSDPDGHIKLNRMAIRGTPAQSTCEPGRERQRELMSGDITVRTVRHSKDFRERAGELLDPPNSIGVEGHREKYIMALFNRTDLKKTRAARRVLIWLDSNNRVLKHASGLSPMSAPAKSNICSYVWRHMLDQQCQPVAIMRPSGPNATRG
jgi:hypothetical protein